MRARIPLLIAVAVSSVSSLAVGQRASPPKRAHHALVYDDTRHVVLMTGGSTPLDGGQRFQFFNDLWAFSDSGWQLLGESGEQLSGVGLAWDDRRQMVLSFGGFNGNSLGELRRLEINQWRALGTHPSVLAAEPGFAYDSKRGRFVTFGGSGQSGLNGETWEYDGTSWTKRNTTSPPARQAHAMVYDAGRGVTVIFGGMGTGPAGQPSPSLGDTWEFDGNTWASRDVIGPPPRRAPGVAYDSKRGLVVLFGGLGANGALGDTWAWNGIAWRRLATTGPEPRAMGYMAYDKARDRVVLFGGRKGWPNDLDDTWEWDGVSWKRIDN